MVEPDINSVIIIPLYKDWDCLEILIEKIKNIKQPDFVATKIIVVDDFSLEQLPEYLSKYLNTIDVLELTRNLGHQKAINIGLSYAVENYPNAINFVIMDADGEDLPEDIPKLIDSIRNEKYGVCFAHRGKRNEKLVFQLYYRFYKLLFRVLTGKKISFGNFCILTNASAKRIIHVPEIWLHFSSGVIKSKLTVFTIPTSRGFRYLGESKMNYTNLINHGLSAISVFSELVAVRITLISIFISIFSVVGIGIVLYMKEVAHLAIPGWASVLSTALMILITQFFSLGILLSFIVLSAKTIKNINPSLIYKEFIYGVHKF